jgi:hypothetical protein
MIVMMKNAKKMTLPLFHKWLKDNVNCELRLTKSRVDAVICADVIEPGTFAALFAIMEGSELLISELTERFPTREDAWAALEAVQEETADLEPFAQWLQDQFWSAKNVKVETINF